jgi:hypothetical protein
VRQPHKISDRCGVFASNWPRVHLDTTVSTLGDLRTQHERALALEAFLLLDRSDDEEEPLFVYADPAGHPFCIFVGA